MKRVFKKFVKIISSHDIILRIYISFAVVLGITGILTAGIFMQLYQKNYIKSYTSLLTKQGNSIAARVGGYVAADDVKGFQHYNECIDEIESAENTDIWIVKNDNSKNPLTDDYTNADTSDGTLTNEMYEVLGNAYKDKISSNTSYDKVYGMVILRVAVPIQDKESGDIAGAVMLVSMIDRQTMGIEEGKYLITISILASLIISYIVAFGFSKSLSKPISKLTRDIVRIASGDYSKIKIKKPRSQIGRLEKKIDSLAMQLSKAEEERNNLEKVRMDFFANVSHELRTPITVLRGYAETLNDGVITDHEFITDVYQRMLLECQGMERLVGDLFILSKMQNPDFKIDKEPVSVLQIFGDIVRNARVMGKEKRISIIEDFPDDPCMMLGDYVRLRQMFMVIVDNAIKFSHEDGRIYIEVKKENSKLYISIRDEGIGISKEDIPYIFEKFYKSKLKQNEKGTGLGLMIAKQIALKHDGEIKVDSKEGVGTTFSFEFDECVELDEFE
ncbi:MAG: HAMP domain-containing histidine kinase [Lachnospiraceae bacterium]|nr:HAMP domain-containing histidine kinase [Lachnospiraceae bacterium]